MKKWGEIRLTVRYLFIFSAVVLFLFSGIPVACMEGGELSEAAGETMEDGASVAERGMTESDAEATLGEAAAEQGERILSDPGNEGLSVQRPEIPEIVVSPDGLPVQTPPTSAPTDVHSTQGSIGKDSAEVAQAQPQQVQAVSEANVSAQETGPAVEQPPVKEPSTAGETPDQVKQSKIKAKEDAFTAKQNAEANLKKAQSDASAAKENLDNVRKTGSPEEIQSAQDDYIAKQNTLSKAQTDNADALTHYKETWGDASFDQWNDACSIRDNAKTELETAQTKVDGAQQELDQINAKKAQLEKEGPPDRNDPKYTKNGAFDEEKFNADENAYNTQKSDLDAQESAIQEKLDAANSELSSAKERFNQWKTKARLEGAKAAGKTLLEHGKFIGEQLVMSVAFTIVPDIFQSITQTLQNKALYQEITSTQTFAGIKMRIPSGLVSEKNPAGGFFLYYDVDATLGDNEPTEAYLTSPARRWFVSYDPSDSFVKPGSSYITSSNFPYTMLELSTGFIFDASGAAVDPFNPTLTLLKSTENNDLITPKGQILENILTEDIYGPASGMKSDNTYSDINAVSIVSGDVNKHEIDAPGNTTVANLFKSAKSTDYVPVLTGTLAAYQTPTAIPNFGTQSNPLLVSEMQGLGSLIRVFGEAYFSAFQPYNTAQVTQEGTTFLNSLKSAHGQISSLDQALTPFTEYTKVGFSQEAHPVGLGFYVYQTDSTPTAIFLKKFVAGSSSADLAEFVHDYVILLDQNETPVSATIPMVVTTGGNATVNLVPNPNVMQVVSLVSGLAYSAHNGYQPMLQQVPSGASASSVPLLPGPANTTLANTWLQSKQATSASDEFLNQISQMQTLLSLAVQQGPFQLAGGKLAVRVPALAMFGNTYEQTKEAEQTAQALGSIASGAGIPSTSLPFWQQQASTKESYIYMIHDAFEVEQQDATGKVIGHVSLPDYVVPVTVGTDGRYVLVPLGTRVMHEANFDLPSPSSQVQALISLVTSKMYSADYTPLPLSYTTTVGGKSNQPLYTAFMETELNPVNAGITDSGDFVKIPPFYFLYLNQFSYCGSTSSTTAQSATFVSPYRCAQPTALADAFIKVLPETFTGIPLIGQEAASGQSVQTPSESSASTSSTQDAIADALSDIAKGNIPTIQQVHLAWYSQMIGANANAARLAAEPMQFTQNQGVNDWFITATSLTDIENGNFFYQTNQASGLWVAATYSGTDNKVTGAINDLASAGFTNVGKDFSTIRGNALLNVGTGEVLISMQNPSASSGQLYVVNSLGRYDKNGNLINKIQFNPADILTAAITNQGKQPLLGGVLQKLIARLQSGKIGTQMGPYLFGNKRLYIDRESYNNGNFVYVEYASDGTTAQDYFVTVGSSFNYATNPIDQSTTKLASMVSGLRYNSSGTLEDWETITGQQEDYAGETSELTNKTLFYQFIEGVIQAQSGVPLNQTIKNSIAQLAQTYAQNKAASPQEQAAQTTYEQVLAIALQSTLPVATLNAATPLDGTDGIIQTSDGQYYWRSDAPAASSGGNGSGVPLYQYYQFKFNSSSLPANVPQPVGVLYDHTGKALEVYTGNRAAGMLASHGLTETQSGVLSLGIPVRHGSLPMTTSDTDLAGGKTGGFLMQLIPNAQNPLHVTTNNQTFYLYKNIFHSGSVPPVTSIPEVANMVAQYSPFDLLMQVTPTQNVSGAYYISLLSGCMYDMQGQQIPTRASLYFQHIQNATGTSSSATTSPSLASNLPLVMWGAGNSIEAMVRMGTDGTVGDFIIDHFGAEYQYVNGSNMLFNFTYNPFEQFQYCASADTGNISLSNGQGVCPSGTWPIVGGLGSVCMVSDTQALINKTSSTGQTAQYGQLVTPTVSSAAGGASQPSCPAGSSLLSQVKEYCATFDAAHTVTLKPASGACPAGTYSVNPNGVVYKVQIAPDGNNNSIVAMYPSTGIPPTGAAFDIQNGAQQNMATALTQAQHDGLYPSQQIFNMTTQSTPLMKIQLRQNQLQGGVINVYQQGALKGTYEPISNTQWKSYALNYVGTRTAGTTAATTHSNFQDTAVIFEDVTSGALNGLVWGGSYYQQSGQAGTFAVPGDSSNTVTASLKTAQQLYGVNAETNLVSNWNVTLQKPTGGTCPVNTTEQSDGTCMVVAAALPQLVQTTSQQKYLSVIIDGSEYVYEFVYPDASLEAVQSMLKGLNAVVAQASNGITSVVSNLDLTSLAPLTSTLVGISPTDKLQAAYDVASQTAQTGSQTAGSIGGQFFNSMKNSNTTLQSSASSNPLVSSGVVSANSNAATSQTDTALLGTVHAAKANSATILQNGVAAGTVLSSRLAERATFFSAQSPILYYSSTTQKVYIKISSALLAYMPDASAAVGQYVQYQMDQEPAGFIFNASGTVDVNNVSIAGTPTGTSITPRDMVALKQALGNFKVHQSSASAQLAPSQSLYTISGGGVTFDDYYSFADLMPGIFTPLVPVTSSTSSTPTTSSTSGVNSSSSTGVSTR